MTDPGSIAHVTGTAYWIAASRARETARTDRLFTDPYAAELAGERGRRMLEQREQPSGKENLFLPVRTRYFDDVVIAWAGRQQRAQVVLLGAGLDTRAFRLPLPADLQVFELDHAQLLEEKQTVLGRSGAEPGCRRRLVPADLEGAWADQLYAAGFDQELPTMWLAEGLFFYLAEQNVRELVRQTADLSAPGSLFAADIFGTGLLRLPTMQTWLRWRADNDLLPPFCTDQPAALFTQAGWSPPTLTQPGSADADYGRLPRMPAGPATLDPTMRTYLVTAER